MYILKSLKDNSLYTGSTKDLRKRMVEHNSGKVISTKLKKPLKLIYYEAFSEESEARQRESNLKSDGRTMNHLKNRFRKSILKSESGGKH